MRIVSMAVTQNHFIFVVKTSNISDEMYAAKNKPQGNPIGFIVSGSANAFISSTGDTEGGSWNPYTTITAPHLHIRSSNTLLGAVATSNDVLYLTVIPREDSILGEWGALNNANTNELFVIENNKQTIEIDENCEVRIRRGLNDFSVVSSETLINSYYTTISDDDINIDE